MTQNELITKVVKEVSSQLTKMLIVEFRKDMIKTILPRVRKTISEEIDRKVKDIVYESVINNKQKSTQTKRQIVEEDYDFEEETPSFQNVQRAKKSIANNQKARQKAKSIADQMFSDDPILSEMIATAHDAEEELNERVVMNHERITNSELIPISEVNGKEVVDPELIDYSEILERTGVT